MDRDVEAVRLSADEVAEVTGGYQVAKVGAPFDDPEFGESAGPTIDGRPIGGIGPVRDPATGGLYTDGE